MRESGEMYLETIQVLKERIVNVRSIDIANEMGFSKPSVSRAVGTLKRDGYITIDEHGFINLTPSGEKIASNIYERHKVLSGLLRSIGVDPKIATEDACKIEHDISDVTFEAIKKYIRDRSLGDGL
ncbi:MAG: metal-dependent transcriptional regulator [Lachnospiraceae bacterium]|nr:metal-dependent transcriptional regulator [Lachnospiraceae bacterium]